MIEPRQSTGKASYDSRCARFLLLLHFWLIHGPMINTLNKQYWLSFLMIQLNINLLMTTIMYIVQCTPKSVLSSISWSSSICLWLQYRCSVVGELSLLFDLWIVADWKALRSPDWSQPSRVDCSGCGTMPNWITARYHILVFVSICSIVQLSSWHHFILFFVLLERRLPLLLTETVSSHTNCEFKKCLRISGSVPIGFSARCRQISSINLIKRLRVVTRGWGEVRGRGGSQANL